MRSFSSPLTPQDSVAAVLQRFLAQKGTAVNAAVTYKSNSLIAP
jgi:hypothetical protein